MEADPTSFNETNMHKTLRIERMKLNSPVLITHSPISLLIVVAGTQGGSLGTAAEPLFRQARG